ncbi:H4MPT-linked C1 transfer pathway protein [bacterium]|nr:H4MPT-linked C1 transfer pathway protein [bacterium]
MPHAIGLDIGGANLKAAHSDGPCRSVPFPVWREPDRLAEVIRELIADWLPCQGLAVTMTAELADCFGTKAEGVDAILTAVTEVAGGLPVAVWQTAGEFVDVDVAREFPLLTAAANWHALATFVGRLVPTGCALLIDIGSTTTDIIPIIDGLPAPTGRTDGERLISGELVYTGVRRTPLCSISMSAQIACETTRIAAEVFATTLDAYLLIGEIPEDRDDCDTANNRPATIEFAHDRVARQLCRDKTELTLEQARNVADLFARIQELHISAAIEQVVEGLANPPSAVIYSGSGNFLTRRIAAVHDKLVSFRRDKHQGVPHRLSDTSQYFIADVFSPETATAACAFALARLALERNALVASDDLSLFFGFGAGGHNTQ